MEESQIPIQAPTLGSPTPPVETSSEEGTLSFDFLEGVPENEKSIVSKYVRDWDSKVTKEFQKRSEKYKPYEDLGDVDTLKIAANFHNQLMADPVAFYNNLKKTLDELISEGVLEPMDEGVISPVENTNPALSLPEFEGVPEPFVAEFKSMKEQLAKLDQTVAKRDEDLRMKAEMEQLDKLMSDLHNEHGDFDDEFFLVQLSAGKTPEQALAAWNKVMEKAVGSQQRKTAPPIPTGGSHSSGQVDPSKLSREDRIKFVTAQFSQ